LFSLIGTTYGGNGTTTFALPDLRGRSIVGPNLTSIIQGQNGGNTSAAISVANMPSHNHGTQVFVNTAAGEESLPNNYLASRANTFNQDPTPGAFLGGVTQATVGQGLPFDVSSPYLVVNLCISMQGIFPQRN
jgi:microcystin-dependent protein